MKRVAFDFSDNEAIELDKLVNESKSLSRADLVRKALKLYKFWHKRTKNEGYAVVFEKDGTSQGVEVLL